MMKDKYGNPIPVLFRPFHELTGNWFWWCKNVCTPDEFKALWRFTVSYLREQKRYVYNTAGFANESDFMASYPGDDMVDVVSFDQYHIRPVPMQIARVY
jgi:beta-mannanase